MTVALVFFVCIDIVAIEERSAGYITISQKGQNTLTGGGFNVRHDRGHVPPLSDLPPPDLAL